MSYPTVTLGCSRSLLSDFDQDKLDDSTLSDVTVEQRGGDVDLEATKDLANQLYDFMLSVQGQRGRGAAFERLAAPEVHQKLQLSPVVAGDSGFWRWLTFSNDGRFVEIIEERYGPGAKNREAYLGLGSLKQGFLAYLWLRANAVYLSGASDPYELARRGQSDLWTSHIVRVDFGSMPAMARAFVRFLHPSSDAQTLQVNEYRELIKELNRRNGTTLLELFDEEAASKFVNQVWAERSEWWPDSHAAS